MKNYQLIHLSSERYILDNYNRTANSTTDTSSIVVQPPSPVQDKGLLILESFNCPNKFSFLATNKCTFTYSIAPTTYSLDLTATETSFTDIVNDLNTYFAAHTPAISVAYNSTTGKFTFSYAGAVGNNMVIDFRTTNPLLSYCHSIFGANPTQYTITPGTSLTLGVASLGPNYLFIRIGPTRPSPVSSDEGVTCQFIVPINVNYNDYLEYERERGHTSVVGCYSPFSQAQQVTGWQISLTDGKGTTYSLPNVSWDLVLGLFVE